MAIEIKSNNPVIDELGIFPYATSLGNTYHQELYNYVNNANVVITTTEFSALNSLITSLKSLNVWNGITEFFPLMGNTINSQMVKLKSVSNTLAEKFNGIDNTFTDGKGLFYATQVTTSAKAFKLGVTNMDIYNSNTGFGFISYFRNNSASNVNTLRALYGQGTPLGAFQAGDFGFQIQSATKGQVMREFNSTPGVPAYTNETNLIISNTTWGSTKNVTSRIVRSNGIKIFSSTSQVQLTIPTYTDFLLIGAQKVKDSSTNGAFGWVGNIRLFITTNGTIDESKMPLIEDAINIFISQTGKTL